MMIARLTTRSTLPVKEGHNCSEVVMHVTSPSSNRLLMTVFELAFMSSLQADKTADTIQGDHSTITVGLETLCHTVQCVID